MDTEATARSDSPLKSSKKVEYKVQFVDTSESCKTIRASSVSTKPPEVPRPTSTSLKFNCRAGSATSSSISNLNGSLTPSNSISTKLNKGISNVPATRGKADNFGSTTSLDRKRQSPSFKERPTVLQPLAKRTQSLDRRHRPLAVGDSGATERRRRLNPYPLTIDQNKKGGTSAQPASFPFGSSLYSGSSSLIQNASSYANGESKHRNRPKTCQPNLNSLGQSTSLSSPCTNDTSEHNVVSKLQSFASCDGGTGTSGRDSHDRDWLQKMKRAASRSPHRSRANKSVNSGPLDDSKERPSRRVEDASVRERGYNVHRHSAPEHSCTNENL